MSENGHAHLLPADVATSLGETWVDGEGPLYAKLARSLQRAIDDGHLPGGGYLPSERVLAHTLFVSRSTVVAAYRTLREQGTLASRRGSGTWIRGRSGGAYGDEEALGTLARDPYLSSVIDTSSAPIDLTLPAPRAVLERIASVLSRDTTWTGLLGDASPLGYQPRGLRSFRPLPRRLPQRARSRTVASRQSRC